MVGWTIIITITVCITLIVISNIHKMKYHIHIPKLEEFALYSSCDSVTKHGTAGLKRPMNRPLYYRCIMTYAAKKCNILTVYKICKQLRSGSLNWKNSEMTLVGAVMLLDHVVLDNTLNLEELQGVLRRLVSKSKADVNAAIECIHRFAGRCVALRKHSLLATILSGVFGCEPCKQIRDILVHYGSKLEIGDPEDSLYTACQNGLVTDIQQIVDSGVELESMHMRLTVESGDVDAIRYVATQLGDRHKLSGEDCELHLTNLTPSICELLVTLGVFDRNLKYVIFDANSVPALGWFFDNDMAMMLGGVLHSAVDKAITNGGPYVAVLHYLIEQAHVRLSSDILTKISCDLASDLGILDYLISCGGIVDQAVAIQSPLLLRYWMDHGLVIDDIDDFCWRAAQRQYERSNMSYDTDDMFFSVMSEMLHFDVNTMYKGQMTLLHHVCVSDTALAPKNNGRQYCEGGRAIYAKALLKHGAKVNVTNASGQTPLHQACCIKTGQYDKNSRILLVTMLIDNGAVVNVIDKRLNTSLHVACEQGFIEIVQLLLEHGAIVNARNSQSKTPYDMTTNAAIRNCLCDHGYMSNVVVQRIV